MLALEKWHPFVKRKLQKQKKTARDSNHKRQTYEDRYNDLAEFIIKSDLSCEYFDRLL